MRIKTVVYYKHRQDHGDDKKNPDSLLVQSTDISFRDFDVVTSLLQNFNLGTNVK